MIDISAKGDTVVFSISGVLDGTKRIHVPMHNLKEMKVHVLGGHIDSWNTNFVAELYGILKNVPKENISFETLPEGMERLLKLAFQSGNTPRVSIKKRLAFLEAVGDKGIIFCRSVKKGGLFIHQCIVSWMQIGRAHV